MKKHIRFTLLILALLIVLSGCGKSKDKDVNAAPSPTSAQNENVQETAPPAAETDEGTAQELPETAEAESASGRSLLMTVGDVGVYAEDVSYIAYQLYSLGRAEDPYQYTQALNYWLLNSVSAEVLAGPETEELLGEDYAALREGYIQEYNGYLNEYAQSMYEEGDTDETKAEKYRLAQKEYEDQGLDENSYVYKSLALDAMDEWIARNVSEEKLTVSDEDILARFGEYAQMDKTYFEDAVTMYEYYTMMSGYESYYQPAGYRGILHILLSSDEALLEAYANAATDDEKEAARQALIDASKAELDDIYASFASGVSFEELIGRYNTDPGMTGSALTEGYPVHKDSITYMEEFTQGAFSDKMLAPGDISDPVVTEYGVHVLYYLRDIPEGVVEMTEEISAEIALEIRTGLVQDAVTEAMKRYPIIYTDLYETMIGEKNVLDD
jgi:PPIC-type PPIASE domain.